MRLVFIHTAEKVKRDSLGNLYTDGAYDNKVWSRYLGLCDDFVFIARMDRKDYSDDVLKSKFNIIDSSKIKVVAIDDILYSLRSFFDIGLRLKNRRVFEDNIKTSDKVIIRMPCGEGSMASKIAVKYKKDCLIECVGCAWDSLWNYSLKGKIIALPSFLKMRNSIKRACSVLYVSNIFLQNRYPTNGRSVGCSDVSLEDSDESIVERRCNFINKAKDKLIIGTIADIGVSYKGHGDVIKAISKLKVMGHKVEYWMAGAGDKSRLENLAIKYNVLDSIKFFGSVPHIRIFEWLDKIDIYIQPSKLEGMPRAVIEAMSRGCPCIGTRVGGIPELLGDDCLYKKGDINQLVDRIVRLKDPAVALGASGANVAKSKEFGNKVLESKRSTFYGGFINTSRVCSAAKIKQGFFSSLVFGVGKIKGLLPFIYLLIADSLLWALCSGPLDQGVAIRLFAATSTITLVYAGYRLYRIRRNILDYSIIFLILIFLFGNGQAFLYMLGVDTSFLNIFHVSSMKSVLSAEIFFSYSLVLYSLGSIIGAKKCDPDQPAQKVGQKYNRALLIVSAIILSVSVIPYFQNLFNLLYISINFGYEEIYNGALASAGPFHNIVSFLIKFFIPGLIIFMYAKRDNKKILYSGLALLCLLAIANMIIGVRGDALMIVIAIVFFYHNFVKRFTKKDYVKALLLTAFIVILVPTVYAFRTTSEKNIGGFLSSFQSAVISKNPIVSTISELGYSMHSFILTSEAVPDKQPFGLGISYLSSIMMVIPSFMLGGFSFSVFAALDTWLQNLYGMPYGPGFSIFAEAYYNFGWLFGCLFIFALGMIFARVFSMVARDRQQNEVVKLFVFIFFYSNMLLARMPMHSTVRNALYLCVIPYIAVVFIAKDGPVKLKNKILSLVGR